MSQFKDYKKDVTQCIQIHRYEPKWLYNNFHSDEFLADDDPAIQGFIHPKLIELLQLIRDTFGVRIKVNSGFRSPEYNATEDIGGAPESTHIYGLGSDITVIKNGEVNQKILDEIYEFLDNLGVGGLHRYSTFIHVDIWGERRW